MNKLRNIPSYYQIAVIYALILFLDRMDITIVNVAIPTLSKIFHIGIELTDWLSSAFLIGLSVAIGASAWLGETYGYKKIFIYAIFGFAVCSLACALSESFTQFVLFRFLQGLCGGIIIPTGNAVLFMSCEKQDYAKVTNFVFLPTLIAPAIAPYIGGLILEHLSYRSIFLINLPICMVIAILGIRVIKEQHNLEKEKFDFTGFLISSLIYILFFTSLSYISRNSFMDAFVLICITATLAYILVKLEKSKISPLIDFKYFKHEFFRKATLIQLFFQMSHFGSFFIIGLYLQLGLGFSPIQAGIVIAMQAVGAIIVAIPARKIFYKRGAVLPICGGLFGVAIITPLILLIGTSTEIIPACIIMLVRGLLSGWVGTPLHTISMFDENLGKKDIGRVGSMFNIARQLSISMGICVSITIVGVTNYFYKFNDTTQTLGHANSLKLFGLGIFSISILCIIGSYIALKIDNTKLLRILRQKQHR